jgi:hypothetical protein
MIILLLLLLYYYYYYYYYYFTIIIIIIIIIIVSIIIIHILTILINNCQTIFSLFRVVNNIIFLSIFQNYTILLIFQNYSLIFSNQPQVKPGKYKNLTILTTRSSPYRERRFINRRPIQYLLKKGS